MSLKQSLKLARQLEQNNLPVQIKARNAIAQNPLLTKGGVHDKENPVQLTRRRRKAVKCELRKTNWLMD